MPQLMAQRIRVEGRPAGVQRGLATLTVVMLLFLVLAMVAAYTGRNLVFEQRTAVNQLRSTQAIEVAQAGVEWAVAMLNGGRITDACAASPGTSNPSFRERNLAIDPANGALTVANMTNGAACVLGGGAWTCSCPAAGTEPAVAAPAGGEVSPAFRIRFVNETNPVLSMVRIEVNACTRVDSDCLNNFPGKALEQDGRVTVYALVSLKGALASVPSAAMVSRDAASIDARIINTVADAGGVTIMGGATVSADVSKLQSTPGSPAANSFLEMESSLLAANLPVDPHPIGKRMFASVFGMWPDTYRHQPAAIDTAVRAVCTGDPCTAAEVRAVVADNPGRPIWIDGGLVIDDSGVIGSPTQPAVIIVANGELNFAAGGTVFGLIYGGRSDSSAPPAWNVTGSGAGKVYGALLAENGLTMNSPNASIVYDRDILRLLRFTQGSFVTVPGSWRDFQ